MMTPQQMQERLMALEVRVSELERKLDNLRRKGPGTATAAGDPGSGGTESP